MSTPTDPIDALRDAMLAAGVTPPISFLLDGTCTRWGDTEGGSRPYWAYGHVLGNGQVAASFGDWRTGITHKFRSWEHGATTAPNEAQRLLDELARRQQLADEEADKRKAERARIDQESWKLLRETGTNAYLERKQVGAYGVRFGSDQHGPFVAVPMRLIQGKFTAYQRIYEDGRKWFPKGTEKKGAHHVIGTLGTAGMLYLAEGYATAATVHEVAKCPAVVAFDAGNLPAVADAIKSIYPDVQLIVTADNDQWKPDKGNAGVEAALAVARKHPGTRVAIPSFVGLAFEPQDGKGPTDFNDLLLLAGAEEVRRQLATPLEYRDAETIFFGKIKAKTRSQRSQCSQSEIEGLADAVDIVERTIENCRSDPGLLVNAEFIEAFALVRANDDAAYFRLRDRLKHSKPSSVSIRDIERRLDSVNSEGEKDERDQIAQQLVAFAFEVGELSHDSTSAPYFTTKEAPRRTFRIDSSAFRDYLSFRFYQHTQDKNGNGKAGIAPSETAIRTAVATLSGSAIHGSPEAQVWLRVAKVEDGYLLDLNNDARQVVKITADGWTILEQSPVKFLASKNAMPLPTPVKGGTVDALWRFCNVPEKVRPLVLAWLLDCLRPETPFPILAFTGEQGSLKSSTQRALRRLLDPNIAELRAMPASQDDLLVAAAWNWIGSFENVSHLSAAQQDDLCRLATGAGSGKRKFYTNDEEVALQVKRPVVINSIVPVIDAQDLSDRQIHIELPEVDAYRPEAEVDSEFAEAAPSILGALLALFADTLKVLRGSIPVDTSIRMIDFAKLGEAMPYIDTETGELKAPLHFSALFAENRMTNAIASLSASSVAQALMEMRDTGKLPFEGVVGDLFARLTQYRGDMEAWPKSPRGLAHALKRQAPALRMVGICVRFAGHGRAGNGMLVKEVELCGHCKAKAKKRQESQKCEHRERCERDSSSFFGKKIFSESANSPPAADDWEVL